MPQKTRKHTRKKKPAATETTHTHVFGTSAAGQKTHLASALKSATESDRQFGILDPHGDMPVMAQELLSGQQAPPRRSKKKSS